MEVLSLVAILLTPQPASEMEQLRRLEEEVFSRPALTRPCPPEDERCTAADVPPDAGVGADLLSTRGLEQDPVAPDRNAPGLLTGPRLAGFAVPVVLNAPVQDYIEFFQGRGKFLFARWLARLGRYKALMASTLEHEGVPPELVFVAMIESGFDPEVVSPAGAVGPWQFVLTTGRNYGLRRDEWVDERKDPVKSTRAAARHLKELYEQFGAWPLAIAAYNTGPGTVVQAVGRSNSNDLWALADAGALPGETARYVAKLFACMIIANDPGHFGFADVTPDTAMDFAEVLVPGGADLRALARKADVSLATLEKLNPELRRGHTPPDGTDYPLRVPSEARERLGSTIDAKAGGRVFAEHVVRFGERLRDIASEYGVAHGELRRINELPTGEPMPGQTLLIPADRHRKPRSTAELLVFHDPGMQFDAQGRQEIYFPVRHRMDVSEVAAFFGVSPGDIGLWNGIDPQQPLLRGMVLHLFVAPEFDLDTAVVVPREALTVVAPGSDAAANAMAHAETERTPALQRVTYKVRRGDSLWEIAQRFGVTVSALQAENGLGSKDRLSPGHTLKVPVQRSTVLTTGPGSAPTSIPTAGVPRVARGRKSVYTVRSGDTLSRIAKMHRVSVRRLCKQNGLKTEANLRPGQTISIP